MRETKATKKDKDSFNKSQQCSCYFCFKTFHNSEIKKWKEKYTIAICPYCGNDTVMFGKISSAYLEQKHNRFFK